jgi:uncharacterized protein (TIGR03435 family)
VGIRDQTGLARGSLPVREFIEIGGILGGFMRTANCWRNALRGTLKLLAVGAPLLFGPIPTAQTPAQTQNGTTAVLPKFAVAAIHPLKPSEPGQGPRTVHATFTPDGLLDEGVPLNRVIQVAFGVSEDQVLRLPDWTRGSYYIAAKVDAADVPQFSKLTLREKWAMVLMLFEERFGLKFHHEMKDMQAYTLVIAKGGPKLKKSSPEELAKNAAAFLQSSPPKVSGSRDGLHVEQNGASMANLVDLVSRIVHSPVIDKTELTGRYDFKLDYSAEVAELATTRGSEQAPNIFTALQEQLGLKLESGKGSVDVVVIDHIEQPSPN